MYGIINIHSTKKNLLKALQEKIQNDYITYWIDAKHKNNSKLSFYSKVNLSNKYELKFYLKTIKNQNFKKAITNLRISTHNLKVETGRHKNIPKEERICEICNKVEDEVHFLDECIKYTTKRHILLK